MVDRPPAVPSHLADEAALLRGRQDAVRHGDGHVPPHPGPGEEREAQACWALALSGGGIRSATCALGVLQAVAGASRDDLTVPGPAGGDAAPGAVHRRSLLSRFDLLSTVSGGGYVGAFLCSLFKPDRVADHGGSPWRAADDAVRVLCSGPPGRIRSAPPPDAERLREPLAWLRENGRYLVPTGVGDAVYAFAIALRNWVAVHYVVGTVLMLVLLGVQLLVQLLRLVDPVLEFERERLGQATTLGASLGDQLWWSPALVVGAVPAGLALVCGLAFWFTYGDARGCCRRVNLASLSALLLALALAALAFWTHRRATTGAAAGAGTDVPWLAWLWLVLALLLAGSVLVYAVAAGGRPAPRVLRVTLTRWLSTMLTFTALLVVLALVDTAGRSFYLAARTGHWPAVLAPAALVPALVVLIRQAVPLFSGGDAPSWLKRIPLTQLGALGGVLVFALMAVLWSTGLQALAWWGREPVWHELVTGAHWADLGITAVLVLGLAALTGRFPGFINLSSLQSFYAARLTRAYLGASNGLRFRQRGDALSAAEPIEGDDLPLGAFHQPATGPKASARLRTLAPLHLVNVTMNKTVDPAEQLVQRDRKGQPFTVLPHGLLVDGAWWPHPGAAHGPEIERPLTLGQWIGVSGAAFSTGIGRETTLGMSLLMGAANVRLGLWWQSGASQEPARHGAWAWTCGQARRLFKTQAYLADELQARFHGLHRPWQYLSDGGHFENTGLYELLRPGRSVGFVLACDHGADPDYRFDDLANLMRLVRIDFGVEVEVMRFARRRDRVLGEVFGQPEDFRPGVAAREGTTVPAALLLRARRVPGACSPGDGEAHTTWIVMLKPVVGPWAGPDVVQYAQAHPTFPQETTADQFFDEAQWESYRALGYAQASRVLAPEVWRALQQWISQQPV